MRASTFTLSPMQPQFDDLPRGDTEQQLSPSMRQRRISSPTPASPHSPSPATSFTYQPPPVYSPPLTNNFLSADEHNTTFIEIDHSGSATTLAAHKPSSAMGLGASAVAKKGANVFARLTDTSSFTGMYKSIAEEKRQNKPDMKPKKPVFQQPVKRHFDQLKGGSASQPLSTTTALLSWPPLTTPLTHSTSANSLSHSSIATIPSSSASHPSSHASSPTLNGVDPQGKPAGGVFSRLTNPQLYPGAHRARFMDAQTKAHHHRVTGELDSNGRPARVASPPRTHSRQPSSSDLPLSVTYDALSTPSLPTIADGEDVVHVGQAMDDSGSADDYHFVEEIRRGISLSLDTNDADAQQHGDGGEQAQAEELLSPTAPPVFHFSSAPGDDDKENSHSQSHGSYNGNGQSNSGDTSPTSKQPFHVHQEADADDRGLSGDGESMDPSRPTHNYNLRSGSQGRVSGTQ